MGEKAASGRETGHLSSGSVYCVRFDKRRRTKPKPSQRPSIHYDTAADQAPVDQQVPLCRLYLTPVFREYEVLRRPHVDGWNRDLGLILGSQVRFHPRLAVDEQPPLGKLYPIAGQAYDPAHELSFAADRCIRPGTAGAALAAFTSSLSRDRIGNELETSWRLEAIDHLIDVQFDLYGFLRMLRSRSRIDRAS